MVDLLPGNLPPDKAIKANAVKAIEQHILSQIEAGAKPAAAVDNASPDADPKSVAAIEEMKAFITDFLYPATDVGAKEDKNIWE